jgi:hypothetical protein
MESILYLDINTSFDKVLQDICCLKELRMKSATEPTSGFRGGQMRYKSERSQDMGFSYNTPILSQVVYICVFLCTINLLNSSGVKPDCQLKNKNQNYIF